MPKVKTNSASKKRFALTGTGKIKRKHAYHSHILTKKSKKRKRNLDKTGLVASANIKQVRELLNLRLVRERDQNNNFLLTGCHAPQEQN